MLVLKVNINFQHKKNFPKKIAKLNYIIPLNISTKWYI